MKLKMLCILALTLVLITAYEVCARSGPYPYCNIKAVRYADNFCWCVCSDSYFMGGGAANEIPYGTRINPPDWGEDCAHYVSCCIGREPHWVWGGGGLPVPPEYGAVYGIVGVETMYKYLDDEFNHVGRRVDTFGELGRGDVILFDVQESPKRFDHSAITGSGLISSHSKVRCAELLETVVGVDEYFFYQIISLGDVVKRDVGSENNLLNNTNWKLGDGVRKSNN